MTENNEHAWIENFLDELPGPPSNEEIQAISDWVNEADCAGLCSIGCGSGFVERRLGLANDNWHITAVDFATWRVEEGEPVPTNVNFFNLTPVSRRTIYPVPANQALFMRYPIGTLWQLYLQRYEGRLIILLATQGNTHNQFSREEIDDILGEEWECLIDLNNSYVYRRL